MDESKNKYNFTFKMLLVALKRQILTIIYFVVCFTIIGAVYSYKFYTPSYESTGSVVAETLNDNIYNAFSNVVKAKVPQLVVEELKSKDITDKGKTISIKDIENGVIVQEKPTSYNSYILDISFHNKNDNITSTILNIVLKQACVTFNDETSVTAKLTKFAVHHEATNPTVITKPIVKMTLFVAVGLGFGVIFALASGCYKYKINSTYELQDLDILTLEIETEVKKNE